MKKVKLGGRERRERKGENKGSGSKTERGEELTVKARVGSPELSVGSAVSGYHAV